MKKNVKKKLVLHRETLHHLAAVTGGTYTYCITQFSGCDGAQCETGTNCNASFCICQ